MGDLHNSLKIATYGVKAQTERMKVISQNIANANSHAYEPDVDPYRRKTITFRNVFDRSMGMEKMVVHKIGQDKSDFRLRFDPGHPAADEKGYVKMTNVNSIIESADMKEAQRSYEANLNVVETSKGMIQRAIGLLQ